MRRTEGISESETHMGVSVLFFEMPHEFVHSGRFLQRHTNPAPPPPPPTPPPKKKKKKNLTSKTFDKGVIILKDEQNLRFLQFSCLEIIIIISHD
jgi:hypothetical protein